MSDITRIIPKPAPTTLGGRSFLASEYRLDDVAALQAWIKSRVPCPYDRAAGDLAYLEGREYKRRLSTAIDEQMGYPPEPGDHPANALLDSELGRKIQIGLALRREHPDLSPSEISDLFPEITLDEWERLSRIAWGMDPLHALSRIVDGPPEGPSGSVDWGDLWYRYITEVTGPAPSFDQLTISQYIHFRAGGSPSRGIVTGPGAIETALRREAFFAELEEPEGSEHEH